MQKPSIRCVLLILTALFLTWPTVSFAATKLHPSYFGTNEIRSSNMKPFKKWRTALKRFVKERKSGKKYKCRDKKFDMCDYDDWMKFLRGLKGKSKLAQVKAVNAYMNRAEYIIDQSNWGKNDYWASPQQFFSRAGDCEDFAITKYLSLRMLGFKDKELRVVAVKDLNLKIGHAVLMIVTKDRKTGKPRYLMLDNQIKKVVDPRRIKHYQPVFSINQNFWWRHKPS